MKIIEALQFLNPMTTAESIMIGCRKMSEAEFRVFQKDMLARAQVFAESSDNNFSASLDEGEAVTYASACQSFAQALQKAKEKAMRDKAIAAAALESMAAWWHLLENVRTSQ